MNKFSAIALQKCFTDAVEKRKYNKELFSLIAPKYNKATKILSLYNDHKWKTNLINKLENLKRPICLDIACGTGDVTFQLAQKYTGGTIYGLDITQAMIDSANRRNIFSNIEFVCSDMCNTQFEDNFFDIITASYALRNSPDLNKTLNEIKRILKPNATLAILDFSKVDNNFLQKLHYYILKSWGNLWGIILHQNHTTYGYIAESLKHFPNEKEFEKLLFNYNFKIIYKKKFFFCMIKLIIVKCEK